MAPDTFEVILLKEEEKKLKELVSLYRKNELTPETAMVGIGVIAGMRSLLTRMDKQTLRARTHAA